jgi:cytochrome c2
MVARSIIRISGMLRYSSAAFLILLAACNRSDEGESGIGNPKVGKIVIARQACGSCHEIPGVENSDGLVGPPLAHFASRTIIAGLLPNTPAALETWLRLPQSVVPGNAMPDMGLTEKQARDVTAYLYTLQ